MHIQTLVEAHMQLRGDETHASHPLVADAQVSFSFSDGHNREGTWYFYDFQQESLFIDGCMPELPLQCYKEVHQSLGIYNWQRII
jgi:hypothetical protein